nr:hypothetical protein [Tanacetum cinerariifolium]
MKMYLCMISSLKGKTRGFDQITDKDAIILYSLANGINIDYASIFWEDIVIKLNKRHREKVVSYARFLSLLMIHKIKERELTLYPTPNPSSNAERVPQGTNPRAQLRHKKQSTSLKQPSVFSKEATKGGSSKTPSGSKTGHSKKRNESNSAIDLNTSQPLVSTSLDTKMHKEDQQATSGPTSLGVTSEARANPQLSSDQTKYFNKLTKEVKGLKKQVHKLEIKLPGDLKEIPSKLEDFTKNVISLTSQVAELKTLQWELPVEFLALPVHVASVQAKLKTLDALLVKMKMDLYPWDLEAVVVEFLALPVHVASVQAKLKTLDALLGSPQPEGEHIKKDKGKKAMSLEEAEKESTNSVSDNDKTHVTGFMVESSRTKKLKKFDFKTKDGRLIHLTEEEINHQKKLEEDAKAEAAKQEREVRKAELVDLLGPEVVKKYYNDKLQYDRYYDKMLNRIQESRITSCDVLTRKGLITFKVYREDGTSEIIPNFKASDLHLGK